MFGYIVPSLSALDEEERTRYRAVYCGVCRSIRERYGQRARLTVTYDMTFLALVLGSLYEPVEETGANRCPVHPAHLQSWARSHWTDYAADLSVALAYHKLKDDWADDRSARAFAASAALAGPYHRAKARRPEACRAIEEALADIRAIEQAPKSADADAAANRFGLLLGDLFVAQDDFWATELRRFGARLGKFVYVMDAVMDLEEDRRTGNYNPFAHTDLAAGELRQNLELLAAAAADAFERLPLERDVHVLRSVLYAGMWQRFTAKENENSDG